MMATKCDDTRSTAVTTCANKNSVLPFLRYTKKTSYYVHDECDVLDYDELLAETRRRKKKTYGNDLVTKGVFTVAQEIRKHCIFTRFEIHRFDWKLPSLFGGGGRIEQIETFSCELPCRDNWRRPKICFEQCDRMNLIKIFAFSKLWDFFGFLLHVRLHKNTHTQDGRKWTQWRKNCRQNTIEIQAQNATENVAHSVIQSIRWK